MKGYLGKITTGNTTQYYISSDEFLVSGQSVLERAYEPATGSDVWRNSGSAYTVDNVSVNRTEERDRVDYNRPEYIIEVDYDGDHYDYLPLYNYDGGSIINDGNKLYYGYIRTDVAPEKLMGPIDGDITVTVKIKDVNHDYTCSLFDTQTLKNRLGKYSLDIDSASIRETFDHRLVLILGPHQEPLI